MKKLVMGLFVTIAITANAQYKLGDAVGNFKMKNIDGKTISLTAQSNEAKGIIVVFTCNHCPFSKAYEDRIIELHKNYAPKGYPVMAVNPNDKDKSPDDSYDKMQERAREKAFPFPYLYDETQEVAKAFGAARTPHVFILQKVGDQFIVKYIGGIDNNTEDANKADKKYAEDALNDLLSGKDPIVPETKAIGCTIKWK